MVVDIHSYADSEFSSGMPLNEVVRSPPPASVETVQVTPASKASDPAENAYFERDFRRMYPKLQMITQPEISNLLINASEQLKWVMIFTSPSFAIQSLYFCHTKD